MTVVINNVTSDGANEAERPYLIEEIWHWRFEANTHLRNKREIFSEASNIELKHLVLCIYQTPELN